MGEDSTEVLVVELAVLGSLEVAEEEEETELVEVVEEPFPSQ
jgi:hypothetical protein